MEEGNTPPPTFEEAIQSDALKKGTAYPRQEVWSPAGDHAADGRPGASHLLVSEVISCDISLGWIACYMKGVFCSWK
jgi:hypothetical protein